MAAIAPMGTATRRPSLGPLRAILLRYKRFLAERVGFEPTVAINHTAFRERHLQPLGHLSGSVEYTGERVEAQEVVPPLQRFADRW
jgi:hypothetical protein